MRTGGGWGWGDRTGLFVSLQFCVLLTVIHEPEAWAAPEGWLKIQNLRPHPNLLEQNLHLGRLVIHRQVTFWEVLLQLITIPFPLVFPTAVLSKFVFTLESPGKRTEMSMCNLPFHPRPYGCDLVGLGCGLSTENFKDAQILMCCQL